MSVIIIATGTVTLGGTTLDKDGNVVSKTDAQFTEDNEGGSVIVYKANPDTMEPEDGTEPAVFGDWQATEYLAKALELINPKRGTNIPDFKGIFKAALPDLPSYIIENMCTDCGQFFNCGGECILKEWVEEEREERQRRIYKETHHDQM